MNAKSLMVVTVLVLAIVGCGRAQEPTSPPATPVAPATVAPAPTAAAAFSTLDEIEKSCAPGAVKLNITATKKVFEQSEPLAVRYMLSDPEWKSRAGQGADKNALSLTWYVAYSTGKIVTSAMTPPDKLAARESENTVEDVTVKAESELPAGDMKLLAVYYHAQSGQSPVSARSNVVAIAIKPDGWREKAYAYYAAALADNLQKLFRENAFEFPEMRKSDQCAVTTDKRAASGRICMDTESLQIDDKAKTARLRTVPGELTFKVVDALEPVEAATLVPVAPSNLNNPEAVSSMPASIPVEPLYTGEVEGGLVRIDVFVNVGNKWAEGRIKEELPGIVARLNAAPYAGQPYVPTAVGSTESQMWTPAYPPKLPGTTMTPEIPESLK